MANAYNTVAADAGNNLRLDNVVLDVYSQEILFQAQPNLRFESVAVRRTELGVQPGHTISFLRFNSLTGDSAIGESDTIETDTMSTSLIQITVSEHAKALGFTEYLVRTSLVDVMEQATTLLGQHYVSERDTLVANKLYAGSNVLYAKDRADRASLGATDYFDVNLIRDAVETLATAKAPKFELDAYLCFVHPHQSRHLRADDAWVAVQHYGSPENIRSGEIGRIEDVRFIETTKVPYVKIATQDIWIDGTDSTQNTSEAANSNTNVYRAVVVGDYAVGLAEALPVELRDNGVQDFGRTREIAYYGIWGAGLIEENHSLILETA